ncbi:hypothetical protein KJY77_01315 [Canibacter sp. lx-72]|uniref:hypothetical protein n=1 Tax=Canibacter zhuwentaonis TaxID=2837491 RepID=UPI001BDDB797|nr:hypothetical protein [Canibacter zhuwentaonis]MBT1017782.1 hypothetical protein [Canibacter zhuwentaonis]
MTQILFFPQGAGGTVSNTGVWGFLDHLNVIFSALFVYVRGLPMFATLLGFGVGIIALNLLRKGISLRGARRILARR